MSNRLPSFSAKVFIASMALALMVPASASASTTSWSPVSDLSATGGTAYEPQVTSDANGNVTVLWNRLTGPNYIAQSTSKSVNGVWSAVTNLSAVGQDAYEPKITSDPAGNVTAIWYQNDDSVRTASKPVGGTWGSVTTLSPAGSYAASVATDPTGNVTAVWVRSGIIQSATQPLGGSWGAVTDISAAGSNSTSPQIIGDSVGNFTAIWTRNSIVQSATLPAGGTWGTAVDLSVSGQNAFRPSLSTDSSGNVYAIWQYGSTAQTASKSSAGNWSSAVTISGTLTSVSDPKIATDTLGNLSAVWRSQVGLKYVIYSATKTASGSWTSPVGLSEPTQHAQSPQIVSSATGKFVAVWQRSNGTNGIIQTATNSLGTWGTTTDLSAVGRTAEMPALASDPRGNVAAVWQRYNGSHNIVQATTSSVTSEVSFSANGGSGSVSALNYSTAGSAITIPPGTTLSRDGFKFMSWNTAADGTGTSYAPGATFTPTDDLTLYATWNAELAQTGTEIFLPISISSGLGISGLLLLIMRRKFRQHFPGK